MTETLFETTRLRCRRWMRGDIEALFAVYADPLAMRWVDDGEPISRADCDKWFEVTQRNYIRRGYGMFALEDRDSAEVVGFCGLVHPGDQPEPEIKYAFIRSCWGKGFASEAVAGMLAFGASQFGMRSIIATVAPENLASQRVLTKAGARRTDVRSNDDGTDTYVFEWLASSTNDN